jgi:hypothetical protein
MVSVMFQNQPQKVKIQMATESHNRDAGNTVYFFYRVERSHLSAIQCMLEAYEMLGPVSTVDRIASVVRVTATVDFVDLLHLVMANLKEKYTIEELSDWNIH